MNLLLFFFSFWMSSWLIYLHFSFDHLKLFETQNEPLSWGKWGKKMRRKRSTCLLKWTTINIPNNHLYFETLSSFKLTNWNYLLSKVSSCGLVAKAEDSWPRGPGFKPHYEENFSGSIHLDQSLEQKLWKTLTWQCCMCCNTANGRVDFEEWLAY